jgi:hypothetical protein
VKVVFVRVIIAASTVACAALLSFSWCEHRGVLLGIESAEARVARPTAARVVGVSRRQARRSGQELLTAVVAATTTPRNYDDYDCYDDPSYAGRGYPSGYYSSYPGGYCISRGYSTGFYARPTLFPRYYSGSVR